MYNASTGYNTRKARRTRNTRNTRNTMNTRNTRNTMKAMAGSMSMPLPVEGRVTVYGKATCPWCNKMKPLLVPGRDKYVEITLHNMPEFRKHIVPRIGGYKSVPIVFVGTKFIGGYSEYVKL
jgi:glutaredoxin